MNIENLPVKQKAILFTALDNYNTTAELLLIEIEEKKQPASYKEPLLWLLREIKEIKKQVSFDCFPEDMNPLKFYLQENPQAADSKEEILNHINTL